MMHYDHYLLDFDSQTRNRPHFDVQYSECSRTYSGFTVSFYIKVCICGRILLEEAFVTGGTTTIQSNTTKTISGANYLRQPCGIGVGQQGPFLLDIFARLEPDAPSGQYNMIVESIILIVVI